MLPKVLTYICTKERRLRYLCRRTNSALAAQRTLTIEKECALPLPMARKWQHGRQEN